MKPVLVIGGSGLLGSYTLAALGRSHLEAIAVGTKVAPERQLPPHVRYEHGDYGDTEFMKKLLSEVDQVILLAFSTNHSRFQYDPKGYTAERLTKVNGFIHAAKEAGTPHIVVVSTGGAIYGNTPHAPILETAPLEPVSAYGKANAAMEVLVRTALPHSVIVRPSNIYGPGQEPYGGQGFVATAIASAIEGKPISIFGKTGTVRDYLYGEDLGEGVLAALMRGSSGATYNLGSGIGNTNRQIIDLLRPLAKRAGLNIEVERLAERSSDTPYNVLDCTHLKLDTGWTALVSIEHGIEQTWKWMQKRLGR